MLGFEHDSKPERHSFEQAVLVHFILWNSDEFVSVDSAAPAFDIEVWYWGEVLMCYLTSPAHYSLFALIVIRWWSAQVVL